MKKGKGDGRRDKGEGSRGREGGREQRNWNINYSARRIKRWERERRKDD